MKKSDSQRLPVDAPTETDVARAALPRFDRRLGSGLSAKQLSFASDRPGLLKKTSSLSFANKVDESKDSVLSGSFEKRLSPRGSWNQSLENVERLRKSFSEVSADRKSDRRQQSNSWGTHVLAASFSPTGIFVFFRLIPLCVIIFFVLASFCPGSIHSKSFCGDRNFLGIYYEYPSVSLILLSLLGISLVYEIYQCSDFWIRVIETTRSRKLARIFQQIKVFIFDTIQPSEDAKFDTSPIWRPIAVFSYVILSPFLVVFTELALLFGSPFELSTGRFLSDYEIFRSVITGTVFATLGLIGAIVTIAANSSPSAVGILLSVFSALSMFHIVLFLWQFSRDDETEFIVSFVNNCTLASHVSSLLPVETNSPGLALDEAVGECPFYRSMRFRESVDFREQGHMRDFQIVQLLRNIRINPKLRRIYFSSSNKLSVKTGRFVAAQLKQSDSIVQLVNQIHITDRMEVIVLTPDMDRSRAILSRLHDSTLVPWNTEEISWKEGLPWAASRPMKSLDNTLFPFTGAIALAFANPDILLELDIGSNMIGDELADDLSQLVERSKKLMYLEVAQNQFTKKGMDKILNAIIHHPTLEFVRLSTVLLHIGSIRSDSLLDLSLPTIYQAAVSRCVDSLYDCCNDKSNLVGNASAQVLTKLDPVSEKLYIGQIHEVAATQFRQSGRELYRSVPPGVANECIRRVAHRLGKYEIVDPHEKLDLPPDACVDAGIVRMKDIMENRLFMSFLHTDFDIALISKLIEQYNEHIEDLDMKGMPLTGDAFRMILNSLKQKKRIRSLNFSNCAIADPTCAEDVIKFVLESSETLMELNLIGNSAFNGKKNDIWKAISTSDKINTPRIMVDNTM